MLGSPEAPGSIVCYHSRATSGWTTQLLDQMWSAHASSISDTVNPERCPMAFLPVDPLNLHLHVANSPPGRPKADNRNGSSMHSIWRLHVGTKGRMVMLLLNRFGGAFLVADDN